MRKTIILTENQLHQILNGVNVNENKVKTPQQKISQGLSQEFQLKLNNYLETQGQNELDNFASVLLLVMCKLSNKQDPDDIITTQAVKFIEKLNELPNLDDNNKFKQLVQSQNTNDIMKYMTTILKNAQYDVYREEQNYNVQSIDNEDTKYLENTISQQGSGTKINFDPIHFLEFLQDPNVSPLKKSLQAMTFIKTLHDIIINSNPSDKETEKYKYSIDFFDKTQRKVWMKLLYDIYSRNINKKTGTVFVPYEKLDKQNLQTESGKLYLKLLKFFATIFGKGGKARNIKQGEGYKPNLQNKFGKYFEVYQKYLESQHQQNNGISNEIDDMFNDYQ